MALALEGWVEGQDAVQDAAVRWYRDLPREERDAIEKEFWDDPYEFGSARWLAARYQAKTVLTGGEQREVYVWLNRLPSDLLSRVTRESEQRHKQDPTKTRNRHEYEIMHEWSVGGMPKEGPAQEEKRATDMTEKEKDALAAWVMGRSLSERNAFYGELERRWKATGRSREGLYYEIAREWKARAEALEHPRPAPQEEEEKQEWEHIKLLPGRRKVYFRFRDGLSAVGIGGVVGADMAVKLANWLGEDEEEEEQQAEEDTPHPFGDEKAEGEASGEETPEESEESEEEPEQEGEDGELTEEVYEREFGMPEDGEDEEEDDDFEEGGGEDGEEGDDFEEEDEDGGEASEEERIPSEGEGGGDIDVEDFLLALRDGQRAEDDPSGGDGHGTGILIREED